MQIFHLELKWFDWKDKMIQTCKTMCCSPSSLTTCTLWLTAFHCSRTNKSWTQTILVHVTAMWVLWSKSRQWKRLNREEKSQEHVSSFRRCSMLWRFRWVWNRVERARVWASLEKKEEKVVFYFEDPVKSTRLHVQRWEMLLCCVMLQRTRHRC